MSKSKIKRSSKMTPKYQEKENLSFQQIEAIFLHNRFKFRAKKLLSQDYTYLYSEDYMGIKRLMLRKGFSLKVPNSEPEFQMLKKVVIKSGQF